MVLDIDAPSGSLHRYDKSNPDDSTNTELLADGIFFANGVAPSTDGTAIYISETTAARILRYDIASGTIELFLDNVPVLTDNIAVEDGQLLIPGYTRDEGIEVLLKDPMALQQFLAQPPGDVASQFQNSIKPHGNLLIYNETTLELVERIFNMEGKFAIASSAHKLDENEYLVGSAFVPAATRFRIVTSTEQGGEGTTQPPPTEVTEDMDDSKDAEEKDDEASSDSLDDEEELGSSSATLVASSLVAMLMTASVLIQ